MQDLQSIPLLLNQVRALESYLVGTLLRARLDVDIRGTCDVVIAGVLDAVIPILDAATFDLRGAPPT